MSSRLRVPFGVRRLPREARCKSISTTLIRNRCHEIDCSHVADQLSQLVARNNSQWLSRYHKPKFHESGRYAAVARPMWADVGRCGSTWRVIRPPRNEIWSRFGVEKLPPIFMPLKERSRAADLAILLKAIVNSQPLTRLLEG